jgi:uncharacterized membrane protein YhaH (DUF805 family)
MFYIYMLVFYYLLFLFCLFYLIFFVYVGVMQDGRAHDATKEQAPCLVAITVVLTTVHVPM